MTKWWINGSMMKEGT